MQILVLSDTHGYFAFMERVILLHENADMIVHCGDGASDVKRFLELHPDFAPRFHAVCGNCDAGSDLPERITVSLPFGHRLTAVHGHRHIHGDYRKNFTQLAQSEHADIVAFGHSHARTECRVGNVTLFNPGSLALPHDGKPRAFGLIDVLENGLLFSHGDF